MNITEQYPSIVSKVFQNFFFFLVGSFELVMVMSERVYVTALLMKHIFADISLLSSILLVHDSLPYGSIGLVSVFQYILQYAYKLIL